MTHATVPAIGTIWRNLGEQIVVCYVLLDSTEFGGFSVTVKSFMPIGGGCMMALDGETFCRSYIHETEPRPNVVAFAKAVLASVNNARSEIELAYRQRLVENLRNGGAPVRRLLAEEIASGKWDGNA